MANDQLITVTGRLTADPELRFNPSGSAVANFKIAFTPSKFDRNTNAWKDGTPTFWRCAAWNQGKLIRAENICNMLKKGDNVVAQGVLETREYETKEGEKRSVIELSIQSIGKDLTFHGQAYGANESPEQQDGGNWGAATGAQGVGGSAMTQGGGWGNQPGTNQGGWGNDPGGQTY